MMKNVKQRELSAGLMFRTSNPLPVMEHFYTLQGEGAYTGVPSYFIRLAGCDVGCVWCDVKESWKPHHDQYHDLTEMLGWVQEAGADRVVITGGGPSVYDLRPLTEKLRKAGLAVHLETAGPHPLLGEFDWVCFSPKKFLPPNPEYYHQADELKIVIYHESDLTWAEEHAARCAPEVRLFLQPEWSRRDRVTPVIIEYIKSNPHWSLSQQTHKYLDIP